MRQESIIEEKGTAFVISLKTAPEAPLPEIESTQKELYEVTRKQLKAARHQVLKLKGAKESLEDQLDKERLSRNDVLENVVKTMAEQDKVIQKFKQIGTVGGSGIGSKTLLYSKIVEIKIQMGFHCF